MKDIVNYVMNNMDVYVSNMYIKHITNCLEIKGYVKSVKVWRILTRSILREVSGQIDIKF